MASSCYPLERRAKMIPLVGSNLKANKLIEYHSASSMICRTLCISTEQCYYVTFNSSTKVCALFTVGLINYIIADAGAYTIKSIETLVWVIDIF